MTVRGGATNGLAVLAVLAVAGLAAGCGDDPPQQRATATAADPVSVALTAKGAPTLKLGVVVTLTSAPGEGQDWASAAEGAAVAAYRLQQGGVQVTLVPENDRGTDEGAQQAVSELADDGVAGIVLATSGRHVDAALQAAADAGVPVLLPYDTSEADPPGTAFWTGPDQDEVDTTLAAALTARGLAHPLVVDAGGGVPTGVQPAQTVTVEAGDDTAALARRVARTRARTGIDSVVVTGSAPLQAAVVAGLQGADVDLPLFLTPEAQSPAFADALVAAGGSVDLDATTVGTSGGDSTALQADARGAAASAYLAALRQAAGDPELQDFFDGRPFSTVAAYADVRSHDAVVALVRAAAQAGSADPAEVAEALTGLDVTAGDGLAGPELHLTGPAAVAPADVQPLQATTQDPGLRPGTTGAGLTWFVASTQAPAS